MDPPNLAQEIHPNARDQDGERLIGLLDLAKIGQRGFSYILDLYCQRHLTFPSDIDRAFAGIIRRMSSFLGCPFFYGLPVNDLETCLLFYSSVGHQMQRRNGYPAFSWYGWEGPLVFQRILPNEEKRGRIKVWIQWYKRHPHGQVEPIATSDERHSWPWPKWITRLQLPNKQIEPSNHWTAPGLSSLSYSILQFWTVAVYYKALYTEGSPLPPRKPPRPLGLYGRSGEYCGFLRPDNSLVRDIVGTVVELILTSHRTFKSFRHFQKDYKALAIEWTDGIAERVGMASLFFDDIEMWDSLDSLAPGPVWKEILLGRTNRKALLKTSSRDFCFSLHAAPYRLRGVIRQKRHLHCARHLSLVTRGERASKQPSC